MQYHHIHHFSTRVPSYLIRACHDSAPPGLWRYVKYLDFKTELQSLLLVMWNPDTHRFESFSDLNWLLGIHANKVSRISVEEAPAKEE
jgi:omega-6 fatty acid desaturase (delta-12 desaturase)